MIKMFFKKIMPNLFILSTMVMITSCGPELTPCECANSKDPTYQEKCRKYMIGAPHEEYVRFKAEWNKCVNQSEIESEKKVYP